MNDETPPENQQPAENPRLSRLEALYRKAEKLKARIEVEEARKRARDRKADSRRKILYGVAVLAAERADLIDRTMLHDILDQFITADRDRIFLGLEPRGEPVQEQAGSAPAPTKEQQPEVEKSKSGYRPGSFEVHQDTDDL